MLISYTHKFAFIHVPKVAGISISRALAPYGHNPQGYWANRLLDRVGIHVNHYAPYQMKRFRLHTPAQILQRELPAQVFDGLFTFAFVRNPWDWMVSYYHYVQGSLSHHRNRRLSRLASFEDYIHYEARRRKISQSGMLTDRRGRLLVDFVGRYESLAEDFASVCRHLGVEVELPHDNPSRHRDYRDYYEDGRLIDLVATFFSEDIERFGYTFEAAKGDVFRDRSSGHRRAA